MTAGAVRSAITSPSAWNAADVADASQWTDHLAPADIAELEEHYCGRVEVLERMATVSTSARLRRIQLGLPEPGEPPGPPGTGQAPG